MKNSKMSDEECKELAFERETRHDCCRSCGTRRDVKDGECYGCYLHREHATEAKPCPAVVEDSHLEASLEKEREPRAGSNETLLSAVEVKQA